MKVREVISLEPLIVLDDEGRLWERDIRGPWFEIGPSEEEEDD